MVENAHFDLGVRPSLDSAVGLHARYVGVSLLQQAPLRAETPMTAGAMHAIADAYRNFSSRLALAGSVGVHREDETGRYQVHGGAELRFPRMFGETGGLWFGATVEQGWLQGETAYVQFLGHFGERFQVVARLSGDGTRFETPTAIWNLNELGAYAERRRRDRRRGCACAPGRCCARRSWCRACCRSKRRAGASSGSAWPARSDRSGLGPRPGRTSEAEVRGSRRGPSPPMRYSGC